MVTKAKLDKARMVVAVDDSPGSIAALNWAAEHAERYNMFIEVVIAWEQEHLLESTFAGGLGGQTYMAGIDPEVIAATSLEHAVATVFKDGEPSDLSRKVEFGDPISVLIEASKGSELLVVGSRGHGALFDLVLGSVSSKIAVESYCPVLIIHNRK
jgi:nucleotide-binding universal stress UspA family protein